MMPPGVHSDVAERTRIFRALVPYFGKVLPSAFFQKSASVLPVIQRVHPLIKGIHKPEWSTFALSIASMLKSRYSDQLFHNPDRTWWIQYSPEVGSLEVAANAGLVRCMTERQPVIVLHQVSDKTHREGARHRLLGLGFAEQFDATSHLFRIRGLEWSEVTVALGLGLSDELVGTALRLEALEAWTPFVVEDRAVYQVSRQKRYTAFTDIVLENYGYTCAVTGQRFHSSNHVEAEGAHIIAKDVRGTDDPRNGIALSKSVHWAFDQGIFTISDQFEILVNPKARAANIANFPLLEMDRRRVQLPQDNYYWPHPEALAWHKKERFDRFAL